MSVIYLLDGYSLAFRAFYALDAGLTTKDGRPTNAVYGISLMLNKLLEQEKPTHIAAAFDLGKPEARLALYPEYKAQRDRTPPELAEQIPSIREMLAAMGIAVVEMSGHEADDVIGTLTRAAQEQGIDSVVVTSDRDMLQLIGPHTRVMLTRRGVTDAEVMDEEAVQDRYGLTPAQLVDLKALMGDSSDNIKGVKGVGEKTALALLTEYGSLDEIYAKIDTVSRPRLRQLLEDGRESAYISRQLATIKTDLPLGVGPAEIPSLKPDKQRLLALYQNLELKTLSERLAAELSQEGSLPQIGESVNVEVKSVPAGSPEEVSALSRAADIALMLSADNGGSLFVAAGDRVLELPLGEERICSAFVDLLSTATGPRIIVAGCKTLAGKLPCGLSFVSPARIRDVELAAYLLDPGSPDYSAGALVARYLDKACAGAGEAASCLVELWDVMEPLLRERGLMDLYESVEAPLAWVLVEMERAGFTVDAGILAEMEVDIDNRLHVLIDSIHAQAGEEFNVGSPRQLSVILFEKLGLPVIKKTKTGYSTDAEVLETLAGEHEIVRMILDYRTLSKLKSTYLQGLQKVVGGDGKVHTTYNQTVTVTGRLSSTEPNLQNIPIRLEEGRLIRRAFIPAAPFTLLLAADYSQIELRILAHLSRDPLFTEAFVKGEDIHRRTAAEVFGVPLAEVSREMRDRAKAVNFGIVYGISDYGLSRDLRVPRAEAREYIANYFSRYSGIKDYIDGAIAQARELGYVTTMLGRRRYLPDINNRNFSLRSFAERTAMNTPIQGTAADLIKLAMVRVHDSLRKEGLKSRMILQVHDELLFETCETELSRLKEIVRQAMEGALSLTVPLVVDLKVGDNWYNVKPI